jgi:broad specificity phosphatase PhoE
MFEKGRHILLLRHGHRHEIPAGSFGDEVALTDEGRKASESLGRKLGKVQWGEVQSSPLVRCLETATHFLKGAGQNIPVQQSTLLGNPGPFVSNPDMAGPIFLNNTLREIMNKIALGEPIPGIRSLQEGGVLFEKHLKTIKKFPCLMFSHDMIIALLNAYFNNSNQLLERLPDYLDGFCLQFNDAGILFSINFKDS